MRSSSSGVASVAMSLKDGTCRTRTCGSLLRRPWDVRKQLRLISHNHFITCLLRFPSSQWIAMRMSVTNRTGTCSHMEWHGVTWSDMEWHGVTCAITSRCRTFPIYKSWGNTICSGAVMLRRCRIRRYDRDGIGLVSELGEVFLEPWSHGFTQVSSGSRLPQTLGGRKTVLPWLHVFCVLSGNPSLLKKLAFWAFWLSFCRYPRNPHYRQEHTFHCYSKKKRLACKIFKLQRRHVVRAPSWGIWSCGNAESFTVSQLSHKLSAQQSPTKSNNRSRFTCAKAWFSRHGFSAWGQVACLEKSWLKPSLSIEAEAVLRRTLQ